MQQVVKRHPSLVREVGVSVHSACEGVSYDVLHAKLTETAQNSNFPKFGDSLRCPKTPKQASEFNFYRVVEVAASEVCILMCSCVRVQVAMSGRTPFWYDLCSRMLTHKKRTGSTSFTCSIEAEL